MDRDIEFMKEAIELAKMARDKDEVPVGALVVKDGEVISRAYNTRENSKCATHHAEVLAIEEACRVMGGWRNESRYSTRLTGPSLKSPDTDKSSIATIFMNVRYVSDFFILFPFP